MSENNVVKPVTSTVPIVIAVIAWFTFAIPVLGSIVAVLGILDSSKALKANPNLTGCKVARVICVLALIFGVVVDIAEFSHPVS